jgi:DNA-binding GntR family transcriptional regulator
VADNLRERIIDGELAPGQRLVERDLSDELEVSRITIREAFQTLAAEGLVVMLPRRGAAVTEFGPLQVRHLLEVRQPLDVLAAKLAAARHTEQDAAYLRSVLDAARAAMGREDQRGASAANLRFHEAVGQASGNPLLLSHMASLHAQVKRLFRMTRQLQTDHVDDHERILAAILDRDADLAEELAREHLEATATETLAQLESPLSSSQNVR